ncbi:hypothetical protein OPV22_006474 [Ensete ventricosum]|uniref:Uncharacterized protein n=1 Tax=Ensete ventricosum TaxID=4639 RepID=A0AAV8RT16_ENSVE|nr:hypothetical protein OPV22_006474 [Ensete ventricosum]
MAMADEPNQFLMPLMRDVTCEEALCTCRIAIAGLFDPLYLLLSASLVSSPIMPVWGMEGGREITKEEEERSTKRRRKAWFLF